MNDVAGTPAPDQPHIHRWKVGTPLKGVSVGACDCGQRRAFTTTIPARTSLPSATSLAAHELIRLLGAGMHYVFIVSSCRRPVSSLRIRS